MELGLKSSQPYRKSARIVGETMGNTILTGMLPSMMPW